MMRIEQVRLLRLQDIQLKTGKQIELACQEENRGRGDTGEQEESLIWFAAYREKKGITADYYLNPAIHMIWFHTGRRSHES